MWFRFHDSLLFEVMLTGELVIVAFAVTLTELDVVAIDAFAIVVVTFVVGGLDVVLLFEVVLTGELVVVAFAVTLTELEVVAIDVVAVVVVTLVVTAFTLRKCTIKGSKKRSCICIDFSSIASDPRWIVTPFA